MVVVTRGEEGALGFCRQGHVTVPVEKVSVVDTVGAGDTFQATLLAGLAELGRLSKESIQNLQTSEMERLIRRAGHAAAINCSRQGCDPPTLEEIGNLA